jgi:WD40 repeat protein
VGDVACLAFAPGGKALALGTRDGAVKLWDGTAGKVSLTLTGHSGPVTSLAFAGDGNTLVTASQDKTVRLWEVPAGRAGPSTGIGAPLTPWRSPPTAGPSSREAGV